MVPEVSSVHGERRFTISAYFCLIPPGALFFWQRNQWWVLWPALDLWRSHKYSWFWGFHWQDRIAILNIGRAFPGFFCIPESVWSVLCISSALITVMAAQLFKQMLVVFSCSGRVGSGHNIESETSLSLEYYYKCTPDKVFFIVWPVTT